MSEREPEPVFCSECQNEVRIKDARVLVGQVLCPADLAKRPLFQRLKARRLPEDVTRRGGAAFRSFFTALTALMLVVGVSLIWSKGILSEGIGMIVASIFTAFFGMWAGDVVDLLLDILDQLRRNHRA